MTTDIVKWLVSVKPDGTGSIAGGVEVLTWFTNPYKVSVSIYKIFLNNRPP
jgi:hypothetical protein